MKQKHLIVLIAIFCVLFVVSIVKKSQKKAAFERQEVSSSLELSFDESQVQKIQFKKSDASSYDLLKQNGTWQVPSFWNSKADAPKVANLLQELKNLSGDLRGNSSDVLSDFEIEDANSFHVILFNSDEKESIHLLVSYKAPQSGGSFVRVKDTNAVYLIQDSLFPLFGVYGDPKTLELKATHWLALKYLSIDPTKAELISLKKMNGDKESVVFDLMKESSQVIDGKTVDRWTMKNTELPFPVASEKVYRFLGQLSQGMAREVVDPNGQYGFDKPDWILATKEVNQEVKTIKLKSPSEKDADFVYLSVSDSSAVFKISSSTIQSINVEPTYFEPTTPFFDSLKSWQVIRIKVNEKILSIAKELGSDSKSTWKIEGQETQPDEQKIDGYLKGIEEFSITQFLKPNDELPKDISSVSIELETADKQTSKIEISSSPDGAGNYTAVKVGFQPPFFISKATYDKVISLPQ